MVTPAACDRVVMECRHGNIPVEAMQLSFYLSSILNLDANDRTLAFTTRSTLARLRMLYAFLQRHNHPPTAGAGAAAGGSNSSAGDGGNVATAGVSDELHAGSAADSGTADLRQRRAGAASGGDGGGSSSSGSATAAAVQRIRFEPLEHLDSRALLQVYGTSSASWVGATGMVRSVVIMLVIVGMMWFFSRKHGNHNLYY